MRETGHHVRNYALWYLELLVLVANHQSSMTKVFVSATKVIELVVFLRRHFFLNFQTGVRRIVSVAFLRQLTVVSHKMYCLQYLRSDIY